MGSACFPLGKHFTDEFVVYCLVYEETVHKTLFMLHYEAWDVCLLNNCLNK